MTLAKLGHDEAEFIRVSTRFEGDGQAVVCRLDDSAKHGLCLHSSVTSDYMDSWMDRVTKECPIDGVQATCDEDRGYLETGEKFGCIHFEGRGG
jgi:hypothetical protein